MVVSLTACDNPVLVDPYMRAVDSSDECRSMLRQRSNVLDVDDDGKVTYGGGRSAVSIPRLQLIRRRNSADRKVHAYRHFKGSRWLYQVGCGKCEVCDCEKSERKQSKWFTRLSGMISHFRQHGFYRYRRGDRKDFPPGEVFFVTLTVSNELYPGASWVRRLSNTEVSNLNRDPRFRQRSLREVRQWFHEMLHDSAFAKVDMPYTLFPEFGSKNTKRVHLHVFFFISGDPGEAYALLKNLLAWWHRRTLTDQGDVMITDDLMAAAFITKYVMKTGAAQRRVMSSQFGWSNYHVKFELDRHGLDVGIIQGRTDSHYNTVVYTGGDTKWRVFVEKSPLSVISSHENCLDGLRLYLDGLSVAGDLELPKRVHNPLIGAALGPIKEGNKLCVENEDSTLSKILATTRELPAGCKLRLVPFSTRRLRPPAEHPVTSLLSALPPAIQADVLGVYTVSGFGLGLLYKVLRQIFQWYQNKLIASTVPTP